MRIIIALVIAIGLAGCLKGCAADPYSRAHDELRSIDRRAP